MKRITKIRYFVLGHVCWGNLRAHYQRKYNELCSMQEPPLSPDDIKKYAQSHAQSVFFVIGDSHTEIFHKNSMATKVLIAGSEAEPNKRMWFNKSKHFVCYHMFAVTAYNTNNPHATIPSLTKTKFLIENGFLPKGCKVICSFGEIDCRVHIQKQSEKQHRPVEQIIDDVMKNYETFLLMLKKQGYEVIAYGPIPSQSDHIALDPTFPRCGTEIERNKITKLFNQKLELLCKKNQLGYKTLFYDLINKDMTTKDTYLSIEDHVHLGIQSFEKVKKLFLKK